VALLEHYREFLGVILLDYFVKRKEIMFWKTEELVYLHILLSKFKSRFEDTTVGSIDKIMLQERVTSRISFSLEMKFGDQCNNMLKINLG
jgi:hypothetical protein